MDKSLEEMASKTIDITMGIHVDVGPGLLESGYETLLASRLERSGFSIERQLPVKVKIDGIDFQDAFRLDLLVDSKLLIEVKSVEKLAPIHGKQTLTYLRLMNLPLGRLINFEGIVLKDGLKRVANNYRQGME
jgi:GxxExxY protein